MKQKIYIKRINKNIELPKVLRKGDWIDLRAGETVRFNAPQSGTLKAETHDGVTTKHRDVSFDMKNIRLGVAMLLPGGMEAHLANRSGTGKGMGISIINGKGIIDGGPLGFNGPDDEWRYPAIAWRDTTIKEGERICQFRLVLSQKATVWQKLKWLLSSGVEIVEVDDLPHKENRGGGCIRADK